jgi:DHA2 family multidrug resistance protein
VPPAPHPVLTTHPLLGIAAVLLGALIATCTGRLISVGLPDLRGALHLGADEASWIGTSFNGALMFIGPFSVYLGGLLGSRRVLMACGFIFTFASILLPFSPNLPILLVLLVIAGLSAGTFYPLTLSFVLRNLPPKYILVGIAMYAIDIIFATNFSTSLEAWYVDHLSWRWLLWAGAACTPVMMVLIYYGMPWQPLPEAKPGHPKPSWRGFLYASLGVCLIWIALDQGQRLDWLNSRLIVALLVSGLFLVGATIVRHFVLPNPLVNFKFLWNRNTLLLGLVLICFRFVFLAPVVSIPSFLGSVQGYRPLQTGPVLLWLALPQALAGLLAMALLRHIDPRILLTAGFGTVAVACLMNRQVTSVWYGGSFTASQLVLAIGLAFAFNSMVGAIILQVLDSGALSRPIDVLTFAGYFQTVRLFGGEMGATFMQHFIAVREEFHSNILGLNVYLGDPATNRRLFLLDAGLNTRSPSREVALGRAGEILGLQIRQQAFTMAISDSFTLLATACVVCLFIVACMSAVPTQYHKVVAASAPPA